MSHEVCELTSADVPLLIEHLLRHNRENGTDGDAVFMPYEPGHGPPAHERYDRYSQNLRKAIGEPDWMRVFAVRGTRGIIGHVSVLGGGLTTDQHRCGLGIGVERAHRGQGIGAALLRAAIAFAERQPTLSWIDLGVFGHNDGARRLYEAHGFVELGRIPERFLLSTGPVDDVLMARRVG